MMATSILLGVEARLAKTDAMLLLTVVTAAPLSAQPIRVGFASAMSGPSAITGEGVMWGATMAVEEVNAKGGIMGHKVEAFFADNKGTPGEAVGVSVAVPLWTGGFLCRPVLFSPGNARPKGDRAELSRTA